MKKYDYKKKLPLGKISDYIRIPDPSFIRGKRMSMNASAIFQTIQDFFFRAWELIRHLFYNKKYRYTGFGIMIILLISAVLFLYSDFRKVEALTHYNPNMTTKIYDKNGVLISELFEEKREVVSIEEVPKNLVNAFIAVEDNEFFSHHGVNPKGIIRAFFVNIASGRIKQGGSTITQQLSKVLLTSQKKTFARKAREAFIALMMESKYSKEKILELYLNEIFLGQGNYGVESAAQFYFNKPVRELNLAQCSLIATLPSSPNRLSPIRNPKRSMEHHKMALANMVDMGFISIDQAEKAYVDFWNDYLVYINELPPSYNAKSTRVDKAPWFTEYVRRYLVEKYGADVVYKKGLIVNTTLDLNKQLAGQDVLQRALVRQASVSGELAFKNEDYITDNFGDMIGLFSTILPIRPFANQGSLEKKKLEKQLQKNVLDELALLNLMGGWENEIETVEDYLSINVNSAAYQNVEGCLVSIDQRTGYIEAVVGGTEFTSINQLNRVFQMKRQPGSSIKPLLYAAAIESKKFSPSTAVLDSPVVYLDNDGGNWIPENHESEYYGLLRLREALAKSINMIAVRISEAVGVQTVIDYYARLLKFNDDEKKTRIPRNFSIALGSFDVKPYEMARAYAIIANGGKEVIPFYIRNIQTRDGKYLENQEKDIQDKIAQKAAANQLQIIQPSTSQIMISMMESVITQGTGGYASIGRPAAGKTGTTNNFRDAWFVGFTPQLTTAIWVGYDLPGMSLGFGQSGGSVSAPIWGEYMRRAMANELVLDFPIYAGLDHATVCSRSGKLPGPNCRTTINEIFVPGTVPVEYCDICSEGDMQIDLSGKGPRENISNKHKSTIINQMKNDKNNSDILDNVGTDLLK